MMMTLSEAELSLGSKPSTVLWKVGGDALASVLLFFAYKCSVPLTDAWILSTWA